MMLKDFADVKMETITWISDLVRPFFKGRLWLQIWKKKEANETSVVTF